MIFLFCGAVVSKDRQSVIFGVSDAEHNFCREYSVFVCETAGTAIFFYGMADGFNSDSTSCTFGGLENIVFLLYFAIEGVLHMNQKQMIMVGINLHINLSAGGYCFHTCLDGVSSRLENTRHRSISSMERSAGRETIA